MLLSKYKWKEAMEMQDIQVGDKCKNYYAYKDLISCV